jgi:hypothetical protein
MIVFLDMVVSFSVLVSAFCVRSGQFPIPAPGSLQLLITQTQKAEGLAHTGREPHQDPAERVELRWSFVYPAPGRHRPRAFQISGLPVQDGRSAVD